MNTNKMEEIYQKTADVLDSMIPVSWRAIHLYAEVSKEARKVFFYFYPMNSDLPVYNLDIVDEYRVKDQEYEDLEDELYDLCSALWEEFDHQNQEQWSNLTLHLDHSGKFTIDYSYEDLSNVDSYEQQIVWEYIHLGIIPASGRPKSVIDQYLNKQGC